MASDPELDGHQPNGITIDDHVATPPEPSTPQDSGLQPSSQVTLPSTEIPGSPIDPNQSFKTEMNDDRPSAATVIPSSLTPPPSTQVLPTNNNGNVRRTYSQSQQSASALFSPPATILNNIRERQVGSDYAPPSPHQVLEASADELRAMVQTCIAENQKLKMETAHHKLQYSLLSLQADEESKRAVVEHDMVRREVDALRMAEHTRQAKRELSTSSDSTQAKYRQMKMWYEGAMEENESLQRRVKVAKRVIQQKEEETVGLTEERDMLLNRIRENREHFHMLCSPGGIFHGALTPRQPGISSPQQYRSTPRQASRTSQHDDLNDREHGLSALLQAMSQDNNSAPSTPMVSHRAVQQRHTGRHSRNAQSMSSLPTTPINRTRDSGLLPSVDLVPQTEPRPRHSGGQRSFVPTLTSTPTPKRNQRRKSRESTISAEDNEELARQAMESAAVASLTSSGGKMGRSRRQGDEAEEDEEEDEEVFDSQASQAAVEMLRRNAKQSFEMSSARGSRARSPVMGDRAGKGVLARGATIAGGGGQGQGQGDKRKFSGGPVGGERGSPKKMRVGLGIQYE